MTGEQCQLILESMGFVVRRRWEYETFISVEFMRPYSSIHEPPHAPRVRFSLVPDTVLPGGRAMDQWVDESNREVLREIGIQVTDELIAAADALRHCS